MSTSRDLSDREKAFKSAHSTSIQTVERTKSWVREEVQDTTVTPAKECTLSVPITNVEMIIPICKLVPVMKL